MAMYYEGTVTVANASATVTGLGTSWSSNVVAGNSFKIAAESTVYTVASVDSDTVIQLTAPYSGTGGSGLSYYIHTSFSPTDELYEPDFYDMDWPVLLAQKTIRRIDGNLLNTHYRNKINQTYNLKTDFDAVGNGSTDDTAAFTSAISTMPEGSTLFIPAGQYRITTGILWSKRFNIIGEGVRYIEQDSRLLISDFDDGDGTIIFADFYSATCEYAFKVVESDTIIKGMGFFTKQTVPGASWTPAATPWAIIATMRGTNLADVNSGANITIKDILIFNHTYGIWGNGSSALRLSRVRLQPLGIGIKLAYIYHLMQVDHVEMWPFWSNANGSDNVRDYMVDHAVGWEIGRIDGIAGTDIFSIGLNKTFRYVDSDATTDPDFPANVVYATTALSGGPNSINLVHVYIDTLIGYGWSIETTEAGNPRGITPITSVTGLYPATPQGESGYIVQSLAGTGAHSIIINGGSASGSYPLTGMFNVLGSASVYVNNFRGLRWDSGDTGESLVATGDDATVRFIGVTWDGFTIGSRVIHSGTGVFTQDLTPAGTVEGALQYRNADGTALEANDGVLIYERVGDLNIGVQVANKGAQLIAVTTDTSSANDYANVQCVTYDPNGYEAVSTIFLQTLDYEYNQEIVGLGTDRYIGAIRIGSRDSSENSVSIRTISVKSTEAWTAANNGTKIEFSNGFTGSNGTSRIVGIFHTSGTLELPVASSGIKFSDGTTQTTASIFPSQTGNNGKFLKTNGTVLSWGGMDISDEGVQVNAGAEVLNFVGAGVSVANYNTEIVNITIPADVISTGKSGGQTIIGGTQAADDLILQGTSGNAASTGQGNIILKTGNNGATTAVTVDYNGFVGIGTTTPQSYLDCTNGTASIKITTPGNIPAMSFYKAGTSIASPTTVVSGDYAAYIQPNFYDGAAYRSFGYTVFQVNGTVSSGTVPTDFIVTTGTTSAVERLRISSGGNVGIGTATPSTLLHLSKNDTLGGITLKSFGTTKGVYGLSLYTAEGTEASPSNVTNTLFASGYVQRHLAGYIRSNGSELERVSMWAFAEAIPSGTTAPMSWVLATNSTGSPLPRQTIKSTGEVYFGSLTLGSSGITPEGGFYTCYYAKETLAKGEIVYFVQAGTDAHVSKATTGATSTQMPIGVVYEAVTYTADNTNIVKVIWGGRCDCLWDSGGTTPAMGMVAYVSSRVGAAAGSFNCANTPSTGDHWAEIGHVISATAISTNHYWLHLHFN